jgi:hypothetical protein
MDKKCIILFLFLGFLGSGCEDAIEKPDPEAAGYRYAPYAMGDARIYKTDSIFFGKTNFLIRDTVHCYILESVRDSFLNGEDQIIYEIDFYTASTPDGPWVFADNGFLQMGPDKMIRTEWGLDFVQLIFPVKRYLRWNGNARISDRNMILVKGEPFEPFLYWKGNSYYYQDIRQMDTIEGKSYQKVLWVDEISYEDDLVNYVKSFRKYAWDVGMVYREFWMLKTSIDSGDKSWAEKAEQGLIIRQSLERKN